MESETAVLTPYSGIHDNHERAAEKNKRKVGSSDVHMWSHQHL